MRRFWTVAALLISSPLLAQDSTTQLNEVVVTANKYPNKTSLTGKVVTVINRQDIERAGSRDLSQLLTEQGGLYINGAASNPGKDKSVYVRGGRVEHTLVTIDGVPVYDASGIGSNFDIRNIPIDAVERIEILKGSQSTLYGSDAIAGVINIITRKGGSKPFGGYGALNAGSYKTVRANAGINGKVDGFDYNVGYTFYHTGGISEAARPAGSTEVFDKDAYQQNSLNASFGVQATPTLRLQPYLRYAHSEGDLDNEGFSDAKDYSTTIKNLQTGLRNELSLGAAKVNLLYHFTLTDRRYFQPSNQSSYESGEHFAEAFGVYPTGRFTFTGGLDFRSSRTDQLSGSPFIPDLGHDSAHHNQAGLYAALNYGAPRGFNLEAGGRFNQHSEYGPHLAFNLNPSFLLNRQLKVFANLSSGYKTPGLYQLFSAYGNPGLQPENSINLEGGVQFYARDGRASLRATYFDRTIKDVIGYGFNTTTLKFQYINQNEQKDHGFELEGEWNLAGKLKAKMLYAFVDGKVNTSVAGKDTSYFNLYRRPKSQLTASLGSQLTKALYVSLQASAIGKNTDVTFPPPTYMQKEVKLGSYVLLNFYAEYSLVKNRLKLFADGRNLTGEKYQEIWGYSTPGFNAHGGVRVSF
ncbi:MAG TPA: TonB-dependent receptor [Chitinophagaceae bacterium]